MLGDSLTAGYGVKAISALPSVLEQKLKRDGLDVEILNAGVSGDTTAGGLARLDWVLRDSPDIVIIALGANDALRGLDPSSARRNLQQIIEQVQERGIRPVLMGMKAPRNLGRSYFTAFDAIYPELSRQYRIPLYPFLLEGVAGQAALNLPDGIHPNEKGLREIANRIKPFLKPIIEQASSE